MQRSWNDITVKQYKELYKCKNEFETLSVLSGFSVEELQNGSIEILKAIRKEWVVVLYDQMPNLPSPKIKIAGKEYFFDHLKICAGQYADLQVLTTSNKAIEISKKYGENEIPLEELQKIGKLTSDLIISNIENIISILCKPNDVLYSKYDNELLLKDIENCSIVEVYGLINFFMISPEQFAKNMESFLMEVKKEAKNHILSKQSTEFGLNYFMKLPKITYLLWRLSRIKV